MILAIDCGNTNIVFALYDMDGTSRAVWRVDTKSAELYLRCEQAFYQACEKQTVSKEHVTAVIIASVVPDVTPQLCDFSQDFLAIEAMLVQGTDTDLELDIAIDFPEQLGADRIVNAFGAACHGYLPAIILDFGTATTFDIVLPAAKGSSAQALYDGGIIAPGVHRSLEALVAAAAKLPPLAIESWPADQPIIGKSTKTAMQSGVLWGYVCLIEGMLARIKAHYQMEMMVIATGGLAYLFAPHISEIDKIEASLTTDALFQIARNRMQG